jgi:putative ABC transport system substrate-binding protein
LTARAQVSDRIRQIGVLMNLPAEHPDASNRDRVFRQALRELGWTDGNSKIEYRWGGADVGLFRRYASELVALAPDVIVGAASGWIVTELQRATHTVPIVIVGTMDPVTEGYLPSIARPGGNVTGLSRIEYRFSTKWLELLKQIAPSVSRAAILRDSKWNGDRQYAAIEAAAPLLGVELRLVIFTDAGELERAIAAFADEPNGGIVVTAGTWATVNSQLIIALAAKHRLPAVYPNSSHVSRGGLISYGPSVINQYRAAAGYVDRILRGAKPADLPVQAPTSFETVLNLKTAEALGLEVPRLVQLRVDQFVK